MDFRPSQAEEAVCLRTLGYKKIWQQSEGNFKSPVKITKGRTVDKFQEMSIQSFDILNAP